MPLTTFLRYDMRIRPVNKAGVLAIVVVAIVLQGLVGLVVLLQLNGFAIALGFGSLLIVAAYPFMKRLMAMPQLVLGLAFAWGGLMGFAAHSGQRRAARRAC